MSAPPSNGTGAGTGPAAPRPWDTPPATQAPDQAAAAGAPTQAWDPSTTGTPTQPWEPSSTGTPTEAWDPGSEGTATQPWESGGVEAPTRPWESGGAEAPARPWEASTASAPPQREMAPAGQQQPQPPPVDFKPANDVEKSLLAAAAEGSTDTFLSTLLLAKVLLPVSPVSADGTRPGEPGFAWLTETIDAEPYVVVFTSIDRLRDHLGETIETIDVKFMQLIKAWPDATWSFAVNPSTPVGAKLPGAQILALANWATDVGLGGDTEEIEPASRPIKKSATPDPSQPTLMQKAVAPSQVDYYLERGYDRVSGLVHRANEVAHLDTPAKVYAALGLSYMGSAFKRDADEIYVLRWPAYRPSLYRIPYGGQNEPAMRAMEGWVIERAPFRGNGFAPSESGDVIAEFKVDSARLPHGAQLWRITADGSEKLVALLDADAPTWRKVGEE
nr:SseB family protein [Phytohabitans houttuyneae]